ncbi:MAG: M1 family aminopeptidase [Saprospiraceae bacterium]
MKQTLLLFLIIFCLSNVDAQNDNWQLCDISEAEAKASQYNQFSESLNKSLLTNSYDLKYHRLELEVDPNIYYIKGNITSYFLVKQNNINSIYFDVSDSLTVDSVLYHGMQLTFERSERDILKINLPNSLSQNTLDSLTIYYQGEPSTGEGFGSFVQDFHENEPIIWTLSEPYGAKDWWVCKQSLADKIDSVDIFVTVPKGNKVASNGLLISEIEQGNEVIFHWKHRYLIETYLIAIAVTNYVEFSDYFNSPNNDSLLVLNYVYPEDSARFRNKALRTLDFLEIYNELFGEYPFINEKYGHAQFSRGGGMEHQTMSFMTDYNFELVAHELVHQWFGNKVTCGSWEDIWLNESFATYFTGIAYERIFPDLYWKPWREIQMENSREKSDLSVFVEDTTEVARIFNYSTTYAKGAMMLHTLRWIVGDEAFFDAIYNFINDPRLVFSYAQSTDFIRHVEQSSGMNLKPFFNDWLYGSGYPSYTISWEIISESETKLTIFQTQNNESVDFYELPLPIRIQNGNQTQDFVLEHTFDGQEFTINTNFEPDTLMLDADLWILKGYDIVYQNQPLEDMVTISPNPATDVARVKLKNSIETITYISLYNSVGQLLSQEAIKNLRNYPIDVTNLESGVYFVEVTTSIGKIVKRMIVN